MPRNAETMNGPTMNARAGSPAGEISPEGQIAAPFTAPRECFFKSSRRANSHAVHGVVGIVTIDERAFQRAFFLLFKGR
ncbi:MAG: hypothetical protein DMF62_15685 [Acidobacteria bacterium]|nr:MAG: hypothetical protein DMF62_15685 [Acidobacteriota bacterium]